MTNENPPVVCQRCDHLYIYPKKEGVFLCDVFIVDGRLRLCDSVRFGTQCPAFKLKIEEDNYE